DTAVAMGQDSTQQSALTAAPPFVALCRSYTELLIEAGRPLLLDGAIARKEAILARAGSMIAPEVDAAVRARFNIHFR
ncbi:MAG: methyltransferase, partial [Gemmobacter sp.]